MSTIAASNEQLLQEIREANLAYLVLAQHMIRADKAQALYRLGVSEEVATIIDQLSPAQLMKIAGSNQLILRFRFDDDMVWNLLTSHSKPKSSATGARRRRPACQHRDGRAIANVDRVTSKPVGEGIIMRIKSIVTESKQIQRAIALIKLGARLQVLESETDLSYERLLRLYKEVQGESPARGMLPFSTDWFMTWQPNIHSSLFLNMYEYLNKTSELEEIDGDHQGLRAVPGADSRRRASSRCCR